MAKIFRTWNLFSAHPFFERATHHWATVPNGGSERPAPLTGVMGDDMTTVEAIAAKHEMDAKPSIIWGPISAAVARRDGALRGTASVLIHPTQTAELREILAGVRSLIPRALLPCAYDTKITLARRLSQCEFLDEINVLRNGSGPQRVRLNSTSYPQPRRVTWSDQVSHDTETYLGLDPAPEGYIYLYAYTQYGRMPCDWRCRAMEPPVTALKLCLWQAVRGAGVLTPFCQHTPPNAAQMMMYYTAFGSSVGRHRDNYCHNHLLHYLSSGRDVEACTTLDSGHTASSDSNSQIPGSDVLIWTDGNAPMDLILSFPDPKNLEGPRKTYLVHPTFTVSLWAGTLFVFKASDDLFFCHEASFAESILDAIGNAGYRFAYVFRWLQSVRLFSTNWPFGMVVPNELLEQASARKAAKQKRKRSQGY